MTMARDVKIDATGSMTLVFTQEDFLVGNQLS